MHFFRRLKIPTFPGTQKSLQAQINAFIYSTYPEYTKNIPLDERTSHLMVKYY